MTRFAAALFSLFIGVPAVAHPASGIVADRQGNLYFLDTGSGVFKLDAHGALTHVPGPAFHWMAVDQENRLARTPMPPGSGGEIARAGANPTLLLASDFPIATGRDGNLYYPARAGRGAVEVVRVTPAGQKSVLTTLPVGWLNGLATGPDGSLYLTENNAIRKIDRQGRVTTIAEGVAPEGCAAIPGNEAGSGPQLRGLDVDAAGTIYVAASGCGSVLMVAPDGKITTVHQLQAPWSPTAVVKVGSDLYVLEYLHVATEDRRLWIPRVRKISAAGTSAIVATVNRP
jgi:DNA-binding beta-propeller fold protein YncE